MYLVHRGGWPSPRGLNANRTLQPPPGPIFRQECWEEVRAGPRRVHHKQTAISMYRSQFPLIGRFLLSFVAKNELFARPKTPRLQHVERGAFCVGASWTAWPVQPILQDPLQDTLTRQVERAADIATVRAVRDDAFLYIQIGLARRPVAEVDYELALYPTPRDKSVHLSLRPPGRVGQKLAGMWHQQSEVVLRPRDAFLEVAIPGHLLSTTGGRIRSFFVSVTTRYRGLTVDRTGLHFVQADSGTWQEEGIVYAVATPADLSACAALFAEVFTERIRRVMGAMPPLRVLRDLFRLCHQADPDALIVALRQGRVIGYVFAPTSFERIWRAMMGQGQFAVWLRQWLRGRVRWDRTPGRLLLLDQIQFRRSSVGEERAMESRVLSFAVAPAARRQGVGTQLLHHALRRLRTGGVQHVRLEVRSWNEPALHICRKLGFQTVDQTRDSLGEWLVMSVKL